MKVKDDALNYETVPAKSFLDAFLRLRPGAFASNARLLLAVAKEMARNGGKRLVLPVDAVRGGDCGSLNTHPVFLAALKKIERKFYESLKKMKNAPEIQFATKGSDPCLTKGSGLYIKGSDPSGECEGSDPEVWGQTLGVGSDPSGRAMGADPGGEWSLVKTLIEDAGPDPRFPFGGRPDEVFARQVTGLARRLAAIGCKDAVIGLSGGLDSALTLLVTVWAFKLLGLDLKGVHVYTMPGFGTTKRTRGNADLLAEGLGVKLETIDITPACRQHFKDIRQPATRHDITFENAQARERTQILMDKANQSGGVVLGTGDMSEIALGWCTYNGDHMSMFGVNSGVPKTVVREVCRWWAELHPGMAADALLDILATPVSPELLPAKRGKITQKTEDKVGPYELHDFFLWHFAWLEESPKQIKSAARRAFRGRYDGETIGRWLGVFLRRMHNQAFKRNCAPDGVRVFGVYMAPDAWHVPSDMSDEWLRL